MRYCTTALSKLSQRILQAKMLLEITYVHVTIFLLFDAFKIVNPFKYLIGFSKIIVSNQTECNKPPAYIWLHSFCKTPL